MNETRPSSRAVAFTVNGVPAPAGSKKGFYNKKAGRVVITDDSKASSPWKAMVADAAAKRMNGGDLLSGAIELHVLFYMPRPKGHFGSGRNANVLRAAAPAFPTVKPDATKLLRALEDACTGLIWRDDAQVVVQHVEKRYGEPARAVVAVAQLTPDPPTEGDAP